MVNLGNHKRVSLHLKTVDGQTLNLLFNLNDFINYNEIVKVLINLANSLGFNTYKAISSNFVLKIYFSKNFDLDSKTSVLKNIKFIKEDRETLEKGISIPDVNIKVLGEKIILVIREPNKYDLLRIIALFVVYPLIMFIALLSKDPYKYHAIIISLAIYSAILFYFKKYLVPIQILFHRLSGEVLISRAFLVKTRFHLSNEREIEIRDFRHDRIGSLIFEVLALLNDNKKILLFLLKHCLK